MALTQVTGPYPIFTDLDGSPLDDGYLYIGAANQDPETNPIQVYWDSALTIPATQPIRTNNGYAWRNGTPGLIYTGGEFSITIRNKRNEFVLYSPVGYGFDPKAASASVVKNDFTGDGVETDFTLSASPSTILATNIFINGVYQEKDSYSLNGNVITFSIAPPLSSSIEILTNETGVINAGNANDISYTLNAPGATLQSVQTKLAQYVSVKDFGAVGDGVADDTAAIQAAVDGTPTGGTIYFPEGEYVVSDEIRIDKPLVVRGAGPGSFIANTGGSYLKQTDNTKNGFTLVPTAGGYAFGQWGIVDVHFFDMAIVGPSNVNYANYGIGVDTTANGGDYHVRECTFNNLNIRYFDTAVNLTGICYLNDFYGGCFIYCTTGFELLRGAASDRGGQTRFYGTTFDLLGDCIRWNLDADSGDISLFGCTLADSKRGLVANEEASIFVSGCSFENLTDTGNGAGIYIEIAEVNPNTSATKTIVGNKFLSNDASIWLEKTTIAFSSGTFAWPMLIDSNTLLDANALKITLPIGDKPMSSQQFVFGSANAGTLNGQVAPSQISANYLGRDMRKQTVVRQFAFGPTGSVDTVLVPDMVVTSARVYLTANSSIFTGLSIGDASNNSRYFLLNALTQPLNTWVDWTPTVPSFVIDSSSKLNLVIFGTVGLQGATGVFEITGYVP